MHPKIQKRRRDVLSAQFSDVDREVRAVCASLAQRIRLAGHLCIGSAEAKDLEGQFQSSIDYIIGIPTTSETGRTARHELIRKLVQLEDYLDSLLNTEWARSRTTAGHQQGLDLCRPSLDCLNIGETR